MSFHCDRKPTFIFQFFFFNDTATTEIYTLSLHDALPISKKLEWITDYFLQVAAYATAIEQVYQATGIQIEEIGRAHV